MSITKLFKRLTLLVMLFGAISTMAQEQVVKWKSSATEVESGLFEVSLVGEIAAGWHVYDTVNREGGPICTTFRVTPNSGAELVGSSEASKNVILVDDEIFGMQIGYYEKMVKLSQRVRVSAAEATVDIYVEYMACNEGSCLPPTEEEFKLTLKPKAAPTVEVKSTPVVESAAETKPEVAVEEVVETPAEEVVETPAKEIVEAPATKEEGSLWAIIIEAILWGFAALLTPCVFPMVPMTVSYFLKGEGGVAMGRVRASLYGFFIVALYTLPIAAIILITRVLGGDAVTADIFNWLATHWLPNLIFFIVFMVFAASFFGAFEITMPSWLVNKSDEKADTKGISGIFFLALTLVLVSFSCTGPIVGSVLIKSTAGEFWTPIITMLAFSIAFALPFTLLALFPSLLKKMPKSGGWLNSVKVVIGFIEVALGFKFLSVADQTYHWGLLDREVYLAIWIVVFSLMGLYLLGKIKFAHDSDMPYLGIGRLSLAIGVFTFVVYMIPGMWGAPLTKLSGYLPPLSSQDFVLSAGAVGTSHQKPIDGEPRKYSDFLHLPNGLQGFFDLEEAEAYAEKVGKPLFIDFTGHGCVNCREMEQRVWADPRVLEILANDYVIVALYMDDKMELPESEWVTTEAGKVLKTLGRINSHYALTQYGVNAQPYYVLKGNDGEMLTEPRGYDLEVENFVKFLRDGLNAYKNK